jgi:fucose permease
MPAIRDGLDLTPGRIGLVLMALSGGSVAMLPISGALVRIFGAGRTVAGAAVVGMTGVTVIGLAGRVWLLALGLLLAGVGVAVWDVAMNVEGADVERRLGRAIMPRFHAAYSLGTVLGAGAGALAAAVDLPVRVHLPVTAGLMLVCTVLAAGRFLNVGPAAPDGIPGTVPGMPAGRDVDPESAADPTPHRPDGAERASAVRAQLAAWTERKTLLIGVLVFATALSEGAANDWLALAVVDGYGAVHAFGALVLAVFVAGMTAARMVGTRVLDRVDHAVVLRGSAIAVVVGTLMIIGGAWLADGAASGPEYALAGVGALFWGVGAALGFPMGMTAAAAEPEHAAPRVSVVSSIGYTAFLAGPPLLGLLGEQVGVARSLLVVTGTVVITIALAGAIKAYQPSRP